MKIDFKKYPGGEIVEKGLRDISLGIYNSVEALAVFIASHRLNEFGFKINENLLKNPNLLLYEELGKKFGNDAHYQYNAIMSRVNKFCTFFQ